MAWTQADEDLHRETMFGIMIHSLTNKKDPQVTEKTELLRFIWFKATRDQLRKIQDIVDSTDT